MFVIIEGVNKGTKPWHDVSTQVNTGSSRLDMFNLLSVSQFEVENLHNISGSEHNKLIN